mmetsp:Transcript_109315/g.296477  ORF Transcript_109315/g.296477 Transcript_109315/m.296477 type:complete len:347 (-) Transcript_109315:7-1047(-)
MHVPAEHDHEDVESVRAGLLLHGVQVAEVGRALRRAPLREHQRVAAARGALLGARRHVQARAEVVAVDAARVAAGEGLPAPGPRRSRALLSPRHGGRRWQRGLLRKPLPQRLAERVLRREPGGTATVLDAAGLPLCPHGAVPRGTPPPRASDDPRPRPAPRLRRAQGAAALGGAQPRDDQEGVALVAVPVLQQAARHIAVVYVGPGEEILRRSQHTGRNARIAGGRRVRRDTAAALVALASSGRSVARRIADAGGLPVGLVANARLVAVAISGRSVAGLVAELHQKVDGGALHPRPLEYTGEQACQEERREYQVQRGSPMRSVRGGRGYHRSWFGARHQSAVAIKI